MPRTTDRPPRLFSTRCILADSAAKKRQDTTGIPPREREMSYTFDLAQVIGVNETWDWDQDALLLGACAVDLKDGRTFHCQSPYAVVLDAWKAYQEHADSITRLRN